MGGFGPVGLEGMGGLRGEVSLGSGFGAVAAGGGQRWADGTFDLRDGQVGVSWAPVATSTVLLRVTPSVGIPFGSVGSSLSFTSLSTGSFDPWLSSSLVVGGAWLGTAAVEARVPLYGGFDGVRQGAFMRGDLGFARRFSKVVVISGLSSVARTAGQDPGGAFTELAVTAGCVWAPIERWAFSVQGRVPFYGGPHYDVAIGLGATVVLGKKESSSGAAH